MCFQRFQHGNDPIKELLFGFGESYVLDAIPVDGFFSLGWGGAVQSGKHHAERFAD